MADETVTPVQAAWAGRAAPRRKGSVLAGWLSSTDHRVIGYTYLTTSFAFFFLAGIMAMLIRGQLMRPSLHVLSDQQDKELFTMHGTIMLLLFATPAFIRSANAIMPLRIGAYAPLNNNTPNLISTAGSWLQAQPAPSPVRTDGPSRS